MFGAAAAVPSCPAVVSPVTLVVGMLATLRRPRVSSKLAGEMMRVNALCPTKRDEEEQGRPDKLADHGDEVVLDREREWAARRRARVPGQRCADAPGAFGGRAVVPPVWGWHLGELTR